MFPPMNRSKSKILSMKNIDRLLRYVTSTSKLGLQTRCIMGYAQIVYRIEWVLKFLVNYHDRNIGYVKLFLLILLYITFCERKQVSWPKFQFNCWKSKICNHNSNSQLKRNEYFMFILHVAWGKMVFQSIFQVLSPIIQDS